MGAAEDAAAAAAAAARAARNADLERLLAVLADEGLDAPGFAALVPADPGSAWDTAAAGRYAADLGSVRVLVRGVASAASALAADAAAERARS